LSDFAYFKETTMNEQERFEQICQPQLQAIKDSIDDLAVLLKGNGKAGLIEIQVRHDERINSICKGIAWLWGIVGSCLSAIIIYIITSYIKTSA
jgi:hypothetical protein